MVWYCSNCLEVPCRSSFILLRCWCVQFFQDSCCWWFWCLRIGKAARFEQQVWLGLIRRVEVEDFRWRYIEPGEEGSLCIQMSFWDIFRCFHWKKHEKNRYWDVPFHFWVDWLWHFVYFSTASEKTSATLTACVVTHAHTHTSPSDSTWSSALSQRLIQKNIISKHKQLKEHVYKILKIQFSPQKNGTRQTQWNSPWCWRKPSETPINRCFENQPSETNIPHGGTSRAQWSKSTWISWTWSQRWEPGGYLPGFPSWENTKPVGWK